MAICKNCIHSKHYKKDFYTCTHEAHDRHLLVGEHQCPDYEVKALEDEPVKLGWDE